MKNTFNYHLKVELNILMGHRLGGKNINLPILD